MRYKLNSNGLAQGSAIPLKSIPFPLEAVIGAGGSLLGSVFSGLFGSSERNTQYEQQRELMKYNQELGFENMRYQQKLGLDTFDKTFQKEASLNSQLMRTSPTIQKEAAIGAGINPASQFGVFSGNLAQSSVPTYTPQGGAPSAPAMPNTDLYGMGSLISKLAELGTVGLAKARKDNADAKGKEIENQGKEEENAIYSALQHYTEPVVENGSLVFKFNPSQEGKEHQLVDTVITNTKTRQGVEAVRLAWSRLMAENAKNLSDISQSELQQKLNEKKLNNSKWLNAVIGSDIETYNKIMQEVDKFDWERELARLQIDIAEIDKEIKLTEKDMKALDLRIREKTNIVPIVERFVHGTWSVEDIIIGLFTAFIASR